MHLQYSERGSIDFTVWARMVHGIISRCTLFSFCLISARSVPIHLAKSLEDLLSLGYWRGHFR